MFNSSVSVALEDNLCINSAPLIFCYANAIQELFCFTLCSTAKQKKQVNQFLGFVSAANRVQKARIDLRVINLRGLGEGN